MTDGDWGEWEDLRDEEGTLERHATTQPWRVPAGAHVEGEVVVADGGSWSGGRWVANGPAMLEEFLRLADASPAAMAAYIPRWGFLDLCDHFLPWDHIHIPEKTRVPYRLGTPSFTFDLTTDCESLAGREPVTAWRYWSGQATALLNIAARLRAGSRGSPSDWRRLAEPPLWSRDADPTLIPALSTFVDLQVSGEPSVERQREWTAQVIDEWLRLAGVRPRVDWTGSRPVLRFATGGLFGALGIQIALAAASVPALTLCAGCALPHQPARLPSRAGRSYCASCRRDKVPGRDAQRRSRAKRKAGDPQFLTREAERKREARRAAREGR